jgi:hypothetical protein
MGTRGLTIVTGIAVFLSFGGIIYAAVTGQVYDGGLGGALAVALTFLVFFADRGTAAAALQARLPGEFPGGSEAADLARLRNAIASMLDWQRKERFHLMISRVLGTLAWGFGDKLAPWLSAVLVHVGTLHP